MDHATNEGTRRYVARIGKQYPETSYRTLGRTNYVVSAVGFGCYRVDEGIPEYEKALNKALRAGCNLIDTSTNYTDGGSERCVGYTTESLIKDRVMTREEIVLVSKVGYVQGHNLDFAKAKEAEGKPYPDMVKYLEECWHNIHPDFIADQLTQSLDRMLQSCVDIYLLHNPEYFFSDVMKRRKKENLTSLRAEFYERIRAAFIQLEKEVKRGRIDWYGVSSNTFGAAENNPEATSLTEMLKIARDISEEHHFAVIQLPMNLLEGGPVLEKNNSEGMTVLEYAQREKIGVLVNRPLNAILGNQMLRLADFNIRDEADLGTQVKKVSALEVEFMETLAPHLSPCPEGMAPKDFFRWGDELGKADLQNMPLEHWQQIEMQMVRPQIQSAINYLNECWQAEHNSVWEKWRQRYLPEVERLMQSLRVECSKRSQKVSETVSNRLETFLPDSLKTQSLSRKAISILANTAGVTSVLNGMRQTRYVDDTMGVMKEEPFKVEKRLYESFRLNK